MEELINPNVLSYDDLKMQVTTFDSVSSTLGTRYYPSWSEFCVWAESLGAIVVESKSSQKLFKLATFIDDTRNDRNVENCYGIEVDYDAQIMAFDSAYEILTSYQILSFIYTTSSHTEEKPRWRILCPFSKPLQGDERHKYVSNLNNILGCILARESFVSSQPYYVGSVKDHYPMKSRRIHGKPIDLIEGSLVEAQKTSMISSSWQRQNGGKSSPNYQIALDALRSRHPGYGDRNWWLKFSGSFYTAVKGVVDDAQALKDWQDWNVAYGERNNAFDNQSTWRDFERSGTNGDFATLADMSDHSIATAWGLFGDNQYDIQLHSNPSEVKKGFYFTRADQLKSEKLLWVVDKIIPNNALSLFFGPSGSTKTFGALSLGLSVATGLPWYGHEVKQGVVIYICGEGRAGINRRIRAWASYVGRDINQVPFYVSSGAADFSLESSIKAVRDRVREFDVSPKLIIIDTLSRNTSGDENDSKEMASLVKSLDTLKDEFSSSVLLVHHTGHTEKDRARGSSVLKGALDSEFRFEKKEGIITVSCTKMKDADEITPLKFKLQDTPVHIDGNFEIGAVLVPLGIQRIPLSPQNQKAVDVVKREANGILKDKFFTVLTEEGVLNGESSSQRRSFRRIISELQEKGLLFVSGNSYFYGQEGQNKDEGRTRADGE